MEKECHAEFISASHKQVSTMYADRLLGSRNKFGMTGLFSNRFFTASNIA